ncbi:glycerate kinase type-2 family protein [Desulfobacter curvatus]|uniref:glycerate kinase type-2 family protein n=1 Tax=Desulfobacter curvatus TaxID=2290 RepID=UPI00036C3E3B|nr:glycerate kinase [Desulfobacter curvatus]
MNNSQPFSDLKAIYHAAIKRVDPYAMVKSRVTLDNNTLKIRLDDQEKCLCLEKFKKIYVLGAGKATAPMARAMEEILGPKLSGGLISVKKGHTDTLNKIKIIEAGHPVPDENSASAARQIIDIAAKGDETTLFINLISGGGSALLACPGEYADTAITLADKQKTTESLLACGADINDINRVRKQLSGIKGGKLARHMYPATSVNLILSDVVGDDLSAIASGPTAPNFTTFTQALGIIKKYGLSTGLPPRAAKMFESGAMQKTDKDHISDDIIFSKVHNILLGNNLSALNAARQQAQSLGYNTLVLSSRITGEAREIAKVFSGMAQDIALGNLPPQPPACVLAGGETTVTITGNGKGGRNQEMALSFLQALEAGPTGIENIFFLSGATDGNDGPTDAAGAFASQTVLEAGKKAGLDINEYLSRHDSYTYFDRAGYLFKPGPTNTNVCDLQILIVT